MTLKVATLPRAQVPLASVLVNGVKYPVIIEEEWNRALYVLVDRTGGTTAPTTTQELHEIADDFSLTASSLQSQIDSLSNAIAEVNARLAAMNNELDARQRIEQIESQLSGFRVPENFVTRISQIEDRLA